MYLFPNSDFRKMWRELTEKSVERVGELLRRETPCTKIILNYNFSNACDLTLNLAQFEQVEFLKNVFSGGEILEVRRFQCEVAYVGEIIIKRRRVQKGQLFLIKGDYSIGKDGGVTFLVRN